MLKSKLLSAAFVTLWLIQSVPANAQVCATRLQGSMACVVPQVYGPNGLQFQLPADINGVDLKDSSLNVVLPLSSLGTELALRPIASPASGVLFTFNQALGTVTQSSESYGPIVAERAETVGRHRIFVAATYDFRDFSSLDGISLKHLPIVLPHAPTNAGGGIDPSFLFSSIPCPGFPFFVSGGPNGCAVFDEDFVTTQDRLNLKVHEFTFNATYGVTSRIDVSVAIPILDVSLGMTSRAHIVRVAPQPVDPTFQTDFLATGGTGYYLFFDSTNAASSVNHTFSKSNSAHGIGDLILRSKWTVLKGERIRVAPGLEVRVPTGDAQNFLGSGAIGVKPFVAASYVARISPHVNVGFEYSGDSILAGNLQTGSVGKLPNEFFYSAGVDTRVGRRLTVAADLLGTRLSSTNRVRVVPFVNRTIDGVAYPGVFTIESYKAPVNMIDIAAGAKYSPGGKFLITGNVVFKANDEGLRAKVVPLVGASYSF